MKALRDTDERLYRRGSGYRGRLGGKSAWHSDAVGAESGADGSEGAEGGAALESDALEEAIGDALEVADIDHLQAVGRLAHDLDPDKYPYTHLTDLTAANYVAGNPLYDVLHDGRTVFDGPPLLSLKSLGGLRTVDGTAVKEWNVDMPALTTTAGGYGGMFTPLTRFTGALPNLQEGRVMFMSSGITSWDVELPSLTTASWMFRSTKLTEWHIDLPNLVDGDSMFFQTYGLRSFSGDLSKLVNGYMFFWDCNVTTFETTNLNHLETATSMNINVEQFDYALPRLKTVLDSWGGVMFTRNLRRFNGTLPALENAPLMFHYCHLDRASVKRVGDTIRDASSDAAPPPIAIGVDKTLQGQVDAELDLIRAKGWTVTANYNA